MNRDPDTNNLEHRRWEMYLLGLVFSLSTLFVLLEYNAPMVEDEDMAMLNDMVKDLELLPALEQELAFESVALPEEPVVTPNINIVDETTNTLDILDELADAAEQGQDTEKADETVTTPELAVTDADDHPLDMRTVQQLPEFPGGMLYFVKWFSKNIGYPPTARDQKVGGKMAASFIVNEDGTVSDLKLLDSFDDRFDQQVLSVLRRMPKWTPGIDQGKPCRTMVVVPLVFTP